VLDHRLFDNKSLRDDTIDEYIGKYNELFNESLARFRAQMPRDLYEKFFGLAYDAKIDMRIFKPRE